MKTRRWLLAAVTIVSCAEHATAPPSPLLGAVESQTNAARLEASRVQLLRGRASMEAYRTSLQMNRPNITDPTELRTNTD